MLLIDTYVAPSPIEGVGVFAGRAIAAGTLIWRFDKKLDRLIAIYTLSRLPEAARAFIERYAYGFQTDPRFLVLESDNGRFMNHAERPNTCFSDPDRGFAIADIAAGEELTCDYGEFSPGFEMLPGRQFLATA